MGYMNFGDGTGPFVEGSSFWNMLMTTTVKDDFLRGFELAEEYDKLYGLYDHADKNDLTSVLRMNPEEDPYTGSKADTLIMHLISLKVPEATGESITTLLEMPSFVLDRIIERVSSLRNREHQALNIPPKPESGK